MGWWGVVSCFLLCCLTRGGVCAQVGNEFSSVEALWSQFENVMAKDAEEGGGGNAGKGEGQEEGEGVKNERIE